MIQYTSLRTLVPSASMILVRQHTRGDKAPIDNSAYRRVPPASADGRAIAIESGRLTDEPRFDSARIGANTGISPLQAVLRCHDLV